MKPKKNINICNDEIGNNKPPFIIAEMSGNHNQSLERALDLVDSAAEAGVNAIKIQTYTADTMTLDIKEGEFLISDKKSLWSGQSLYNLYEKAYTPWEWHETIFNRCNVKGIIGFSTAYDETAVDFLEKLNVPCYKVASFEINDTRLIKKIASTGKPVIISTGMATIAQISETVEVLKGSGCKEYILLKCTSSYPASPEFINLNTIPHMSDLFDCQIGLSDHTLGIGVAIAGVALGATVIEKHFTLSRQDGGVDSVFSLEPNEIKTLVQETERAWQSLGQVHYGPTEGESEALNYRRSLYVVKDIKSGESLSEENCRAIRPGLGLSPKFYELLLGKKINRDLKKGTALRWEFLL
jgi:N-acetylneuraminate synthase